MESCNILLQDLVAVTQLEVKMDRVRQTVAGSGTRPSNAKLSVAGNWHA